MNPFLVLCLMFVNKNIFYRMCEYGVDNTKEIRGAGLSVCF